MKWVIEDEDDTGKGRIGHAGLAARALPLGRYPRERENGIITVGHTFCELRLLLTYNLNHTHRLPNLVVDVSEVS